jgi:hypothetical protein
MAEDLDLDRVINDPAYRRQVIARLNGSGADEQAVDADAAKISPLRQSPAQPASD